MNRCKFLHLFRRKVDGLCLDCAVDRALRRNAMRNHPAGRGRG